MPLVRSVFLLLENQSKGTFCPFILSWGKVGNLLRKVWNFSPTMGKEDGLLGKALAFTTCLCPIAATRSARVHLSVYEGRAGGVRSRHAATHGSSNCRERSSFGL